MNWAGGFQAQAGSARPDMDVAVDQRTGAVAPRPGRVIAASREFGPWLRHLSPVSRLRLAGYIRYKSVSATRATVKMYSSA